jgi:hypothetical protein
VKEDDTSHSRPRNLIADLDCVLVKKERKLSDTTLSPRCTEALECIVAKGLTVSQALRQLQLIGTKKVVRNRAIPREKMRFTATLRKLTSCFFGLLATSPSQAVTVYGRTTVVPIFRRCVAMSGPIDPALRRPLLWKTSCQL